MLNLTPAEKAELRRKWNEAHPNADRLVAFDIAGVFEGEARIVSRCLEEVAAILNDNATTNGEVAIARKLAERAKELEAEEGKG